jgi:hypothetical protein
MALKHETQHTSCFYFYHLVQLIIPQEHYVPRDDPSRDARASAMFCQLLI